MGSRLREDKRGAWRWEWQLGGGGRFANRPYEEGKGSRIRETFA